jgi:hypothetical protein
MCQTIICAAISMFIIFNININIINIMTVCDSDCENCDLGLNFVFSMSDRERSYVAHRMVKCET